MSKLECPKCGFRIHETYKEIYGYVHICQKCTLVVIDFESIIPSAVNLNFQLMRERKVGGE